MATIKIETVAGAQTVTTTKTISAGDLVRFIAAYKRFGRMAAGSTDSQVLTQWAEDVFKEARQITREVERETTVITDIAMT